MDKQKKSIIFSNIFACVMMQIVIYAWISLVSWDINFKHWTYGGWAVWGMMNTATTIYCVKNIKKSIKLYGKS